VIARTVIELCTLWAVHCHFDPAPDPHSTARPDVVDDTAVAAALAELVVRAPIAPPPN
jgi:hypothetical protein